jgi:hypothetical protein
MNLDEKGQILNPLSGGLACSQLIIYKFMPLLKQPEPALEMRQKNWWKSVYAIQNISLSAFVDDIENLQGCKTLNKHRKTFK